jgi:NADH-quinone oxidoreductase subunit J
VIYVFYIAGGIALASAALVVIQRDAMHALLYLVLSLLSLALVFYSLGAHFVAALQVIIYAGAIMVLFLFVIMMLNPERPRGAPRFWHRPLRWLPPLTLAAAMAGAFLYLTLIDEATAAPGGAVVTAYALSGTLFGPYLVAVELASVLLIAAVVGALHLAAGWDSRRRRQR